VVPAGWYDDPASAEHVRWWNGVAWTEHVADKPERPAIAASAAGQQDPIAANRELEAAFGIGTSEIPVQAAIEQEAQLLTRRQVMEAEASRARTGTVASWLIALSPLIALVVLVAAGWVYVYVAPNPLIGLAALIPYLLTLVWGLSDSRTLAQRGFRPASGLWALLGGLGYLIARRIRVAGRGVLAAFIVLAVLVVGLPTVAWLTGAAQPAITALRIQTELSSQLRESGEALSVSCPPIIDSVEVGTVYECDATLADGANGRVYVSIDSTDGDFSYSLGVR